MSGIRYIEWEDSCTFAGWRSQDSADHTTSRIQTVGYLVRETKDTITVATSRSENTNVLDAVTIPRSCIRRVVKIQEPRPRK